MSKFIQLEGFTLRIRSLKKALLVAIGCLLIAMVAALFVLQREERINLLYAVNGDDWDNAAFGQFQQTLAANATVLRKDAKGLTLRSLNRYEAVYLDYKLRHSETLKASIPALMEYVRAGGQLFLENDFANDFPPEFLGAAQIVDLPSTKDLKLAYPEVDPHLRGMQQVFKLFTDNFSHHLTMDTLPGFNWGKGIIPSTAQPIVLKNQVALMTSNRVGKGSVVLASAFLPNRYFITGYDLTSGMDAERGFSNLVKQYQDRTPSLLGIVYFNFKHEVPLKPYFHFAFTAAGYQLRNEYLSYVGKERYGYSIRKVHGPYGRPAMAHQNHFEGLSAIGNKEGIQWAELLKKYNQIPSFSLVRSSFDWNKWYEDVTVQLNTGTSSAPQFTGELDNSFYGSGVKLEAAGQTLKLALYPDEKQLAWPIELPYRAYPAVADFDGDGAADLVAGSADGTLKLYRGLGQQATAYADQALPPNVKPPDTFASGQAVGAALAGGYAAPTAVDVNGDGKPDLVVGDAQGHVWLCLNKGGGVFSPLTPLKAGGAAIKVSAYAAPAVGDYNGDGVPDLVIGDGDGKVFGYPGRRAGASGALEFSGGSLLVSLPARYAAPSVRDMNGDCKADLIIGSNEGDLQVYVQATGGGAWTKQGPLEGQTRNQLGSKTLVGGHNSVPVWYDLNHDGRDDLIVGQLEFGLPVNLDDPNFPYAKQLKEFIDYCREHQLKLYPHVFVHGYKSSAQEQQELALHRKMFDTLGIPWKLTGTNQHTWRTNNQDPGQTLRNESAQDIWFNFGFRPANNPLDPQYGQDYIWGMPFLLTGYELKHPMLLHTPAPILRLSGDYATDDVYKSYTALDMPIDYFYHIEYKFPNKVSELLEFVQYLERIRKEQDYNFMTEPQMAQSFLTTLTSKVTVKQSWANYLWDRLRDKLGKGTHLSLTLRADTSAVPAELAAEYASTLGVAIEPGKAYIEHPFAVDSDIFMEKGPVLYTGLQKPTQLFVSWSKEPFHIMRANVPFTMSQTKNGARIDLLSDGMQQIKLYSPVPITAEGDNLKVEPGNEEGIYTITHFGDKTSVTITFQP